MLLIRETLLFLHSNNEDLYNAYRPRFQAALRCKSWRSKTDGHNALFDKLNSIRVLVDYDAKIF